MVLDEETIDLQFAMYKQYLQDCKNPFRRGNPDDLRALLDTLSPHTHPNTLPVEQMTSKQALLPVLMSCASFLLADQAVTAFMENPFAGLVLEEPQSPDGGGVPSTNLPTADSVEEHTGQCLTFFSQHAAAWVLGANFGRITKRLHAAQIAAWYEEAATVAASVSAEALKLLDTLHRNTTEEDGNKNNTDVQEWVEVLLLNGVAGVERLASVRAESSLALSADNDDDNMNEDQEEQHSNSMSDDGIWSGSAVEATARFMCAMLPSIAGDHATALISLRRFPVTHRLSRAMWTGENETAQQDGSASPSVPTILNKSEPSKFCREGGLLPSTLYQSLCQVFGRDAAYWKESDHANRGYFSFFCDIPPVDTPAANLMEDVVVNYLLPLARRHLTVDEASQLVGYEWWVVSKPSSDDLGTNLHFEHDYALKDLYQNDLRPFLSSSLYLEGHASQSGASVILDQTPDSVNDAEYGWRTSPIENSYLVFAGDLLRGTIPANSRPVVENGDPTVLSHSDVDAATTNESEGSASDRPPEIVGALLPEKCTDCAKVPAAFVTTITNSQLLNMADLWKTPHDQAGLHKSHSDSSEAGHTLTLMVAFWGHRVPDVLLNNTVLSEMLPYSPCGPLPTDTTKHTWVRDIQIGYKVPSASMSSPAPHHQQQLPPQPNNPHDKRQAISQPLGLIRESKLRRIGPAWEAIGAPDDDGDDDNDEGSTHSSSITQSTAADAVPLLQIPPGFANRFFLQSSGATGSIASATGREDGTSSIRTNESTAK